ncbi:toll/interleukin-1 receptor domain-containing protein [Marinobacter sp. Arc7-DN-1]|uniref:toll/interleukin-1 receptor domain-containing protein n=1 Tax=Marinobacter sp. Arc7-DN-1 TaxID=2304594 RepID=UPI000E437E9A|nr:toll/interleukin-1 receptor domain-containing protein [Marinobacter sp. Arc7-DN-1]AXS81906.1 toll/interleukin-1 receptor domain-containing protein [Marinobacter sp. Arc7-DN-1]
MAKLVFSYSHVDEELRNELEKHLMPLKRLGLINTWHDRRIIAGTELHGEINQHFDDADVILLLISPDFINSNYCYDIEVKHALERHAKGEARVVPVILRTCDWHDLPFGKLMATPRDGHPVAKFSHVEDGFYEVVQAIKAVLGELGAGRKSSSSAVSTSSQPATLSSSLGHGPRSSNLGIKKEFSDRDKDIAKREGIQFLSRFFQNSLNEICERNPTLDQDFQQKDADSFEAALYNKGKRVCHCGIWRSGSDMGFGDICYSQSGVSNTSCNDAVSLEDDGIMLGFRSMMGGMVGPGRGSLLTNEGMAEHFWNEFIRPLKF